MTLMSLAVLVEKLVEVFRVCSREPKERNWSFAIKWSRERGQCPEGRVGVKSWCFTFCCCFLMGAITCLYTGGNCLIKRQKWTQAKEGTFGRVIFLKRLEGIPKWRGGVSLNRKTENMSIKEGLKLQ